ncbi:hypothetical protein AAE02nite_13950 [Adhaeribacter aerolatus]|uniref:Alpha-L-rhamnosidase six-hairpin glycosidase domain-containing protein n=1 Tax=Adhaeribacter aerolatus TaxID=670289 RepID=A0A512AVJ0_9BACT|nr:hypothetical protein [Adhaeribacter aerolatus]GEO03731.1 hypothetical protein AAE02nite_13950 [Adhaeribacter aerolatus]
MQLIKKNDIWKICFIIPLTGFLFSGCHSINYKKEDFKTAFENGKLANESYDRSLRLTHAWVQRKDSASGLIPSNFTKKKDVWEPHNAGADNYAFMVLTSYLLDKELLNGEMLQMLNQERKLTSRIKSLPDTYSFSKRSFDTAQPDKNWIVFGTSEYIKDGLVPLTEYMGPSPWRDRMMEMLGDLPEVYSVLKNIDQLGDYKVASEEVNGEMLQTLCRVYWMTGDEKYLDWAIKIGDYYLKGEHDLTQIDYLRLRDHGCEIIGGLSELYVTLHYSRPEIKKQYQPAYYRLLDKVLASGRNEDGLFYNAINPKTGTPADSKTADTFGYVFDAYYAVFLVDKKEEYRQAVLKGLRSLKKKYRNFEWEGTSHDGYADAIEGGINLYNREPESSLKEWIDSEMKVMWAMQKEDGIVGGGWPDGNFSRTNIMYSLWKTQGTHVLPWRKDIILGAEGNSDTLRIALSAVQKWHGKLTFDYKRHKENLHLPIDYPRLNQFPEWFTVDKEAKYNLEIVNQNKQQVLTGEQLINGIPLELNQNEEYHIVVTRR